MSTPHVTPLIAVWHEGSFCFCTGARSRAPNLEQNAQCTVTTAATPTTRDSTSSSKATPPASPTSLLLQRIAAAYEAKYGSVWDVRDSSFHGSEGNVALVLAIEPTKAFGFAKGGPFGQIPAGALLGRMSVRRYVSRVRSGAPTH
ncbi:MAG: hypothetical protein U0841_26165 [Chloroflexia bacterium]